jgi:hypothetical protein
MIKLLLGIIVSSALVYLSLKDISFEEVVRELEGANYVFLLAALAISLLISFLKSLRLGILLSPVEKIHQKRLFPISCSGNMFTILLPARIGELVRPYLISAKSNVAFSASLATIFVERILDLFCILVVLLVLIIRTGLPAWVVRAGYGVLASLIICAFLVVLLHYRRDFVLRFLAAQTGRFPNSLRNRIDSFTQGFTHGLRFMDSRKKTLQALLISALIWTFAGLGFSSVFWIMGLELPTVAAFVILLFTTIGVALPAAPGFLGNYHYGCIIALSLFEVPKTAAVAFSLVSYALGIGVFLLLGLAFLPWMPISYKEVREKLRGASTAQGQAQFL